MSDIDRQIIETIVDHGGSASLLELMSLLGSIPDSDIAEAVDRLQDLDLVKIKQIKESDNSADPLVTVREKALKVA